MAHMVVALNSPNIDPQNTIVLIRGTPANGTVPPFLKTSSPDGSSVLGRSPLQQLSLQGAS